MYNIIENEAKYAKKMQRLGYYVIVNPQVEYAPSLEGFFYEVTASHEKVGSLVRKFVYENENDAINTYFTNGEDYFLDEKDTMYLDGNVLYIGNEQGIKDARS